MTVCGFTVFFCQHSQFLDECRNGEVILATCRDFSKLLLLSKKQKSQVRTHLPPEHSPNITTRQALSCRCASWCTFLLRLTVSKKALIGEIRLLRKLGNTFNYVPNLQTADESIFEWFCWYLISLEKDPRCTFLFVPFKLRCQASFHAVYSASHYKMGFSSFAAHWWSCLCECVAVESENDVIQYLWIGLPRAISSG